MTRILLISVRSITVIVLCVLLLTGCSSLLIHDDDNIAVVAGKVAVRTVNCALTIFSMCASEWIWMEEARAQSMVWYGNGDINGDNYKCQQEASSSSSGATGYIHMPVGKNIMSLPMDSGGGTQINQQLYHSCMRAHGYTLHDGYELDRWREKQVNASVSTPQSEQNANTQYNRGVLYHNGQGVPQDYVQARQWYEKSAAQGNAHAQANLGALYHGGQGVQQDYALARQWYEKAAAQGNATAQANLGRLNRHGLGMPQDYAQARQWFEKAAVQGDANAQADLGLLYSTGTGVRQDYIQARQWYAKAIVQGNAEAQFYLGWMYAYAQGIPQDLVQAYLWLSVSAAQSNKVAAQERDKIVTKMTPSQLADAQQLAQQCQAQQFKGC